MIHQTMSPGVLRRFSNSSRRPSSCRFPRSRIDSLRLFHSSRLVQAAILYYFARPRSQRIDEHRNGTDGIQP